MFFVRCCHRTAMAGKMSINFKTNLMEISEIWKKIVVQLSRMQRIDASVLKYNLFGLMLEIWLWFKMKKNTHLEVNVVMAVNMLPWLQIVLCVHRHISERSHGDQPWTYVYYDINMKIKHVFKKIYIENTYVDFFLFSLW